MSGIAISLYLPSDSSIAHEDAKEEAQRVVKSYLYGKRTSTEINLESTIPSVPRHDRKLYAFKDGKLPSVVRDARSWPVAKPITRKNASVDGSAPADLLVNLQEFPHGPNQYAAHSTLLSDALRRRRESDEEMPPPVFPSDRNLLKTASVDLLLGLGKSQRPVYDDRLLRIGRGVLWNYVEAPHCIYSQDIHPKMKIPKSEAPIKHEFGAITKEKIRNMSERGFWIIPITGSIRSDLASYLSAPSWNTDTSATSPMIGPAYCVWTIARLERLWYYLRESAALFGAISVECVFEGAVSKKPESNLYVIHDEAGSQSSFSYMPICSGDYIKLGCASSQALRLRRILSCIKLEDQDACWMSDCSFLWSTFGGLCLLAA